MNKIVIIFFLIILIFFLIINIYYRNKKYEKFADTVSTLTPEQLLVIANLSPHLTVIKNLSDFATSLINGSLTIPGGLNINGDLNVNGKTTCVNDFNVNKNLIVAGGAGGAGGAGQGARINGNIDISSVGNLIVAGNTNLQNLVANTIDLQNLKVIDMLGVNGNLILSKNLNVNGTITCSNSITAPILKAEKKLYINMFKFEQNETDPAYKANNSNMVLNLKRHDDFGIDLPVIAFFVWNASSGIGVYKDNHPVSSPVRQIWSDTGGDHVNDLVRY